MSGKRPISQRSNNSGSPLKKAKTNTNNYFHKTLQECGLTLKDPPDKCIISSQETINVIRNIKKNIERHFEYPRNLSELFSNLEKECENLDIFKQYLFPNIVRMSEDYLTEHPVADSVLKILLNIPILQTKLADFIFEKATDLAAQTKCGPWIQVILKCFSSLDSIVDGEKMSTNLINLLDITSEKMVRLEIITAIPDIIGDQDHNNISTELSRILSEDQDLIPAILECLSYLCLSDEQYDLLQKKTLNILGWLSKCNYFPNIVKFLLVPSRSSENTLLEAVQGLRDALSWPTTVSTSQDIASSQVLTAIAIRNSMVSSKVAANAWLKVVSNCKVNTDHKPIDIIILLILYSTSEEKQKQVENLMRKHIKSELMKEDLLVEVFQKFKPILKNHLKQLTELTNSLLKTKSEPEVQALASYMYTLMFSELEDQTSCQTLVAELLQLGLDSKTCIMNILLILNNVAAKDMSLLKSQSVQMLTLLDRMDEMPLPEIRETMNLLCGLAYSYKNSVIRDDLHMIIRKELGSSNPKVKIQGILAGIHAVKYLMSHTDDDNEETREMPDDVSYSSAANLPEGDLREAAQIIEMISRSTKQNPDMTAFFYDELSKIISSAPYINKNFISWLTDAVTNDLQQNFIVDSLGTDEIGGLKLCLQYCSNSDSEMDEVIAINIAGLALQSKDEINVGILSPLFQLVQTLHNKQNDGNLASIDALLGCAIIMPKFDLDLIEDMDTKSVTDILDCLVHCVNWFRELLNAFASQNDDALREKLLRRVVQIAEIERTIGDILLKSNMSYKPPISSFNINKYSENVVSLPPTGKQKTQKRNAGEESVLPETSRTQATPPNNTVKNKIIAAHNIGFRQLNLSLLQLLNLNVTNENESDNELTVKTLNFLLICVNNNIDRILVSKIKRKTFLTKEDDVIYEPRKAEECAKTISEIMPRVIAHLEFVTTFIETNMSTNSQESGFLYTSELLDNISCLEQFYNLLTIYFKWIGFKNHNSALLKTSLRTLANSQSTIISLKDLLKAVVEKFEKHENYCLQLSTAVALIEFLSTLQNYSDNKHILKILRNLAQNFLSQQWKTPDGALEKGLIVNQSVDRLASIYFMNTEILSLKNLTLQLTNEIKYLKTRNDTLNTMKFINKGNFPILYRNLGTALFEATKSSLNKGMTNSEHLCLWKEVASIMKYMSEIAKTLENRNNLSAFFKKSMPVLKLFLSQGIPIIELQFKNDTQEVLEILKILQQSTRFLQSLCCHSRLKKDTALMSKVPFMRQLLETLIYKVKAALAANKCSGAFWMGNLKNKNIHGEIITSQDSVESDESNEDCDEQLPDDDDSGNSDEEMFNPDSRSVSDIV